MYVYIYIYRYIYIYYILTYSIVWYLVHDWNMFVYVDQEIQEESARLAHQNVVLFQAWWIQGWNLHHPLHGSLGHDSFAVPWHWIIAFSKKVYCNWKLGGCGMSDDGLVIWISFYFSIYIYIYTYVLGIILELIFFRGVGLYHQPDE